MGPNFVQALDLLIAATNTGLRVQQALMQAAAEGRDISDEELAALRSANDLKSAGLIDKLER